MARTSQDEDAVAALIWSQPFAIAMEWLDANGHLNMAYYHVMFDRTVDLALDALGLGEAYRNGRGCSVFNVETHVVYRREVQAHDEVRASFQLLSADDKRLHAFQLMRRIGDGELVATSESLFVHVDLAARCACPFAAGERANVEAMLRDHARAGAPPFAGRRISPLNAA